MLHNPLGMYAIEAKLARVEALRARVRTATQVLARAQSEIASSRTELVELCIEDLGWTQTKTAQAAGVTQGEISRILATLRAAPDVEPALVAARRGVGVGLRHEVAHLPAREQAYWLTQAIEHGWGVRRLRAAMRRAAEEPKQGRSTPT